MFVKFQLSASNSFLDMRGSQMYSGGAASLTHPLAQKKIHKQQQYLVLPKCLRHFNFAALIVSEI